MNSPRFQDQYPLPLELSDKVETASAPTPSGRTSEDKNIKRRLSSKQCTLQCTYSHIIVTTEQLCLEFFVDGNISHFSNYVSRRKYSILDKDFLTFASKDGRLIDVSMKLNKYGYQKVGHVIQMSRNEIHEITGASDKIINRIESVLEKVGLQLEMTAINWKPGSSRYL